MAHLPPALPPAEQALNSAIVDAVITAIKAGVPIPRALDLAGNVLAGLGDELQREDIRAALSREES